MTTSSMYEDGTYLQCNPTWHQADSAWKAEHIRRILKKNGITPATICEIGCGAGEILTCLADDQGEKTIFHGYDISPQAMDICKKKERSNVHFFHENLLE